MQKKRKTKQALARVIWAKPRVKFKTHISLESIRPISKKCSGKAESLSSVLVES